MLEELTKWWSGQMGEHAFACQDFLKRFFEGYCQRELEIQPFFEDDDNGHWEGSFCDKGFTAKDFSGDCLRAMLEDCLVFLSPKISSVLRGCFDEHFTPEICGMDFCEIRNLMSGCFTSYENRDVLVEVAERAAGMGLSMFWFDKQSGKIQFDAM
jgi:hypothetical protein